MSVEFKHSDFQTGKGILVFPDHYVCVAHTFAQNDAAATTMADGRKIIKAGTIYPSNDANAIGVVWADYDVTNGDITGSLIVHGFVKVKALPVVPTANAIAALNMIKFFPIVAATPTLVCTGLSIEAGEASGTEHDVQVSITGVHFRPEAATISNWTITGESTAKVGVESITVDESGTYVTIHTKNSAAAAAGGVTVVPKAAATSTGSVPGTAATIATVA